MCVIAAHLKNELEEEVLVLSLILNDSHELVLGLGDDSLLGTSGGIESEQQAKRVRVSNKPSGLE